MQDKLEVVYSHIKDLAAEAFQVSRRIDKTMSRAELRRFFSLVFLLKEDPILKLDDPARPSKSDAAFARRYRDEALELSKPEDRTHPLFDYLASKDRMENLARLTIVRFSLDTTRAETLLEFHRRNRKPLAEVVSTKPLATIVLVGGVAAKTIPKEAFEAVKQQQFYGRFQLVVSVLVLCALLFFATPIVAFRWSLREPLAQERFCEELLERVVLISRYEDRTIHQDRDHHVSAKAPEETPRVNPPNS